MSTSSNIFDHVLEATRSEFGSCASTVYNIPYTPIVDSVGLSRDSGFRGLNPPKGLSSQYEPSLLWETARNVCSLQKAADIEQI